MAIFDKILRKKKEKTPRNQPVLQDEGVALGESKTDLGVGAGILGVPHITEKATRGTEMGQYIFRVSPGVNKIQVRRAIEGRYGVSVVAVNMVKAKSKVRRVGRTVGHRPGYTKAVVTLRKGESIELG